MAKKSDTWMPFYVTDYLGDTMHLSTVQHGAYLLLLLACWKAGGSLPDDDAQLSAITRMPMADWRKSAVVLRSFFNAAEGRLEHGRVMKELLRAKELSDKRVAVGKLGGRPTKDKQTETNRFPEQEAKDKQTETHAGVRSLPSPSQENIQPPTPSGVAPPKPRAVRKCPESFELTAELIEWAGREVPSVNAHAETAKFRDHTFKTAISDWPGAWRNWLRKAAEFRPKGGQVESFRERDSRLAAERVAAFTGGLAHDKKALMPLPFERDYSETIEGEAHEARRIAG